MGLKCLRTRKFKKKSISEKQLVEDNHQRRVLEKERCLSYEIFSVFLGKKSMEIFNALFLKELFT